jgi:hypothetical protein
MNSARREISRKTDHTFNEVELIGSMKEALEHAKKARTKGTVLAAKYRGSRQQADK